MFSLSGTINNESGEMNISNYKIVVTESILKVSESGRTRSNCSQTIILYDANKPVPKGYSEKFNCEVKLPR
jgi:hypothetical protein